MFIVATKALSRIWIQHGVCTVQAAAVPYFARSSCGSGLLAPITLVQHWSPCPLRVPYSYFVDLFVATGSCPTADRHRLKQPKEIDFSRLGHFSCSLLPKPHTKTWATRPYRARGKDKLAILLGLHVLYPTKENDDGALTAEAMDQACRTAEACTLIRTRKLPSASTSSILCASRRVVHSAKDSH